MKNRSFSQLGEDLVIANHIEWAGYSLNEKGAFVDIGAYHPHDGSNTYLFYKHGSKGIVADIGTSKKILFKIFRRRDKFINAAVVPDSMVNNKFNFNTSGYGSKTDNLEMSNSAEVIGKSVKVIGITELLETGKDYLFKNWSILSIDAEGMDQKIIESIDFNEFPFTVVCFENFFEDPLKKIQASINNNTHSHMINNGYHLQSICGPSYIYIKNLAIK